MLAATVSLYGINDGLPDEALRNQMQTIASGMVVSVTRSRSVPECRLVEFWDMRAAEQALAALNGATPRVPTISEVCCAETSCLIPVSLSELQHAGPRQQQAEHDLQGAVKCQGCL